MRGIECERLNIVMICTDSPSLLSTLEMDLVSKNVELVKVSVK